MKWEYFKLDEFTKSQTAEKFNIDNTPNEYVVNNLNKLVTNILDPLRKTLGSPIKITSGYRSYLLNKMVGGVKNSQHMSGKAADIQPVGKTFDEFTKFIKDWLKDKDFDQCIIESSGKSRWIHISYDEGHNRKKIFSITK
jgi:hypothetical protein